MSTHLTILVYLLRYSGKQCVSNSFYTFIFIITLKVIKDIEELYFTIYRLFKYSLKPDKMYIGDSV